MDWSITVGIAIGLGVPGLGFTISSLVFLVRMESRTAVLEGYRRDDVSWHKQVDQKLDRIGGELDRLIGAWDARAAKD
jgi:hypothetical protein